LRLGIISDIHSNLDALEAVIPHLQNCDEMICLGDVVGYGPQPNEVVERLRQLNPTVVLMGNHDYAVITGETEWFSANATAAVRWTRQSITEHARNYLATLKPSAKLTKSGKSLGLFHGSPQDPLSEYIFPGIPNDAARKLVIEGDGDIVLLGHTHMPMLYDFTTKMLGNPGSVGQPRDGDSRASFAILNINEAISFKIERVEYDIDSVANKIVRAGLPRFLADRLYLGM
jgi:putative phosphoesterase